MTSDCVNLWERCLSIIRDNISEKAFDTWFREIKPINFTNNELTIKVPSAFVYEYLEEHYIDLIRSVIFRTFGEGTHLLYTFPVAKEEETTIKAEKTPGLPVATPNMPLKVPDVLKQHVYEELDPQLNPKHSFENYYSGMSNKLARAAGEAIAANPGKTAFNPFFLYGESGVGKTHLLQAIGVRIKQSAPMIRVLYVSTHLFQVQYTNAVRTNTVNDFINFYQSIDVLLIDDIQELAGKTQTQNTFFHIFNHLHQNGKQLVMTSDRPPVSLEGMVPRLLTRFKWGLTAEVERPDYDLRRNILVNKIHNDGLSIPEDVIDFIARNVTDNVRDLEGIIVSLMAHSTVFNREITIDLAERVLSNSVFVEKRQITLENIKDVVCNYFNLDQKLLQAKSRKREIVQARQISMYLAKKYTDHSFSRIGDVIGKRDHATVMHACKTISDQLAVDKEMKLNILEIEDQLKG